MPYDRQSLPLSRFAVITEAIDGAVTFHSVCGRAGSEAEACLTEASAGDSKMISQHGIGDELHSIHHPSTRRSPAIPHALLAPDL